ncbi:RHS repeat-associated core domain-containing protein, partial [Bacteroides faecichinchillae]
YAYNVRSWTKSITGTLFSQTLNYQEAITGNTPCYNGNISSMSWKSGVETSQRGYRFTYDGLSRLKDALYGEGATLAANTDRFNEQVTAYDKMGNILGLKRYGQTAAGSYGMIDHLTLTYNGNRLQAVRDACTNSVYGNGTEFKDNSSQMVEYTYDKNGNLIKDLNKNISNIGYNCLNLPDEVTFANGNSIRYEYTADGTKLRTVHKTGAATLTTDYCGNAVYKNGVLRMLLNEAGYVSFPDRKFHFYLKDHQGNVRVVADKDGNVEETNAYYPFGGTFTSTNSVQPYKYNGKELDTRNGLNWYDYGARHYDAAIGRWHTVDMRAEKYKAMSPYNYCGNNPVNYVDLKGDSISFADIQNLDKGIGTNFMQKIVDDLQSLTGLSLTVDNNGIMTYAKDVNGKPMITTTTDANGNTIQVGSTTARGTIANALDHSDMVTVVRGARSGVKPQSNNTVQLGIGQIEGFVKGTVGMDNRTLGWGMTLTHELYHTQVGGGLKDNYSVNYPGDVVSKMNTIRSELNSQGGNYGQRMDYKSMEINSSRYISFDRASQGQLSLGLPPLPVNKYIKYK